MVQRGNKTLVLRYSAVQLSNSKIWAEIDTFYPNFGIFGYIAGILALFYVKTIQKIVSQQEQAVAIAREEQATTRKVVACQGKLIAIFWLEKGRNG